MSRRAMFAGFLSSVLGLAVGLATGVPEGKALARRMFTLRTAAIENELASFSATQFEHADAAHAREAQLNEIRTLDSLSHLPQRPGVAQNAALYLAYARLSLIEQTAGNPSASQSAFAKAAEQWSILHPGSQLTPEQVRQSVHGPDPAAAPQ